MVYIPLCPCEERLSGFLKAQPQNTVNNDPNTLKEKNAYTDNNHIIHVKTTHIRLQIKDNFFYP